MNWLLLRTCSLITLLANGFTLGRLSIEFNGSRSDWAVLIGGAIVLISCLITLAAGELARNRV
jgi:hypothetical protein